MKFDDRSVKLLEGKLKLIRDKAFPFAVRQTLNDQAFAAQRMWRKAFVGKVILRNKYTQSSVQVRKCSPTLVVSQMRSETGSDAKHVKHQEEGQTKHAKGKGLGIPTATARGGIKRPIRGRNYMSAIRLVNIQRGPGGRRQRNAVNMAVARKTGADFVYLHLGRLRGIFAITSSRKPRLIWALNQKSTTSPALNIRQEIQGRAAKHANKRYSLALQKQINRWTGGKR